MEGILELIVQMAFADLQQDIQSSEKCLGSSFGDVLMAILNGLV